MKYSTGPWYFRGAKLKRQVGYICVIDQARGQDGWTLAKFSFCVFMDRDEVEVHRNTKREQGQYPAVLTELTWSIKDLYGIKNTKKMISILFRALERKPVICKSGVLFCLFSFSLTLSIFSFSSSILTEKSQKIFLLPRKIFCKTKLSCNRLDFGEILLREKTGNPERAISAHLGRPLQSMGQKPSTRREGWLA